LVPTVDKETHHKYPSNRTNKCFNLVTKKNCLILTPEMRNLICLCIIVLAVRNINVCNANKENAKITNGTWVVFTDSTAQGGSRAVPLHNIEKRQYLSNQAIVNKFANRKRIIQQYQQKIASLLALQSTVPADLTSRLATAENEIVQLQTDQTNIGYALEAKCATLDELLDGATPAQDCCRAGFVVLCTSRALLQSTPEYGFANYNKGICNTCPTQLLTDRP